MEKLEVMTQQITRVTLPLHPDLVKDVSMIEKIKTVLNVCFRNTFTNCSYSFP